MPSSIAQLLIFTLIGGLLIRDVRRRDGVSSATWLVVLWAVVFASRPVSEWFSAPAGGRSVEAYLEGNATDRTVFLLLIAAGVAVLVRRSAGIGRIVSANPWLIALYAYFLISAIWSDFPFVSFKRWFRESGNLVMVLILLTEQNPIEAIKATFVRCAYLLVPLSFLFVRFIPDLGRFYSGYNSNDVMYIGVTMHKNTLGALLLVSTVFLAWEMIEPHAKAGQRVARFAHIDRGIVLLMCVWLLFMANSATSLVCTAIGVVILTATRYEWTRARLGKVEAYAVVAGTLWLILDPWLNLSELIVTSLGRDMTLTTRTGAWDFVLSQDINPLLGAGFKTFWAGDRMVRLWRELGDIVQAHNGYIETYLEGGMIAVILLSGMLISAFRRIKHRVREGDPFARLCFAFIVITLVYNFTEAAFTQRSLLWIATLAAIAAPKSTSVEQTLTGSIRTIAPTLAPKRLNRPHDQGRPAAFGRDRHVADRKRRV